MTVNWRITAGVAAAATIGASAWRGNLWLIGAAAFLPLLVFLQPSRVSAGTVAAVYYGAASLPVATAARTFFGLSAFHPMPILLWLVTSLLLAAPWFIVWSTNRRQLFWRTPAGLALGVIPPLGLIGFASPITAAGVLFPGAGWVGLFAVAMLPALALWRPVLLGPAVLWAIVANVTFQEPTPPQEWIAVHTNRDHGTPIDLETEFAAGEFLQKSALRSPGTVVVFPEGAVRRWTEATEAFWEPTLVELASSGRTALIGAGLPVPGSAEYRNAVLVVGANSGKPFLQRIPVPMAMWKPFGPRDGVPLRLSGTGTVPVGTERAAMLICYEQLLVWPIVHSALEKPTILVGVANEYWTKHTAVPAAQRACLRAWSRLFGISTIEAINH
jgi:hypothetical protein